MIYEAVLSVILSAFLSEVVKWLQELIRGEKPRFFQLGGMPSTHTASVAALCLAVYLEQGLSLVFLACVVFGWLVCRDAYGVRWEVTRHSTALNKLLNTKTYQRAGHTPLQVFAGILFGILVTVLTYWLW